MPLPDDPDRKLVARLMDGYLSTFYVAARSRLADLLRDGPRSSVGASSLLHGSSLTERSTKMRTSGFVSRLS